MGNPTQLEEYIVLRDSLGILGVCSLSRWLSLMYHTIGFLFKHLFWQIVVVLPFNAIDAAC